MNHKCAGQNAHVLTITASTKCIMQNSAWRIEINELKP